MPCSNTAGLSTIADATVTDQIAKASGTTSTAATVSSRPTAALTATNNLVLGIYPDPGSRTALTADADCAERVNVSPSPASHLLVADRTFDVGVTPNATVGIDANTNRLRQRSR